MTIKIIPKTILFVTLSFRIRYANTKESSRARTVNATANPAANIEGGK